MDRTEVENIAELKVRQYCDQLTKSFAEQVAQFITLHDSDDKAHGAVEKRLDRAVWIMVGVAFAGGGAGAVVTKVLGFLV